MANAEIPIDVEAKFGGYLLTCKEVPEYSRWFNRDEATAVHLAFDGCRDPDCPCYQAGREAQDRGR